MYHIIRGMYTNTSIIHTASRCRVLLYVTSYARRFSPRKVEGTKLKEDPKSNFFSMADFPFVRLYLISYTYHTHQRPERLFPGALHSTPLPVASRAQHDTRETAEIFTRFRHA